MSILLRIWAGFNSLNANYDKKKSVKYKCKNFKQAMYKVLKLQKLEICTLIYLVFIFKVGKEEKNVEETV